MSNSLSLIFCIVTNLVNVSGLSFVSGKMPLRLMVGLYACYVRKTTWLISKMQHACENSFLHNCGSNFSSSTLGFTLGTSREHQKGSAYTGGSTIYYSVNGIQNYNIIVEGIGTLFSQHVKISGSYNTKTGAYTMKQK